MPHGSGRLTAQERARRELARARRRTRGILASSILVLFGGLALVQCQNDDRANGAACVKDEDCTSGFCSGQVCVAAPPTLDSEPPGVDAPAADVSAPDVKRSEDAAREADVTATDATDSGKDAPADHEKHEGDATDADSKDGG